ncbi:MAG: glycerophosphoryl diester phosphodiesterase membrane domain-containing protein [Sphingomonadales bacterium]|nr:glycerophosphoryl diester phosphodiesterase membrane domain-containing protein [Sphingomonadales bacterium]
MQFDSSRAWQDATAAIAANRDMLLALAGVFFMLPWLAFMLLVPQTEIKPGMAPAQIQAATQQFMAQAMPYLMGLLLVETCGVLAVLTLCNDHSRPTVGEAIRRGALGVLPYIGAMLLFVIGLMLVIGVLGVGLARGGSAGGALLVALMFALMFYGQVRMVMVAPAIAIEHCYQPWRLVRRSWQLTRGNVGRVMLFLGLLVLAYWVVMSVVALIVGSLATLVAGQQASHIAEAVVSATVMGLFQLLMTSVMAAIHAQLAGPGVAPFR